MSKKRKSQVVMLDHSKAKVLLLQKYLEKYLNIIANDGYTQRINVFDLFCGEGIYENEGEGSPIAILRTLKDLHFANKGKNKNIVKVDLFFNDKDEFKIQKLASIISEKKLHYEMFGKITYRSREYKEIIDSLSTYIQNLKNEKAFVFIDPYGYKSIRASEIKKLLLSKKSEVLLFLPTQFMYRFDEKGTPEALIQIIEELVDIREWKVNSSVFQFIEQFKDALKNYLGKDFFVDTFAIEKDTATVFCLFFFSSHIRGFEKMLETKWEIDDDEGKGWSYEKSGNLFSDFNPNRLEEMLMTLISANNKVSNSAVYEFTLRNGFLPTHAVEIFNSMQTDGKLEVFSYAGEKVRKGAFYINYENYKASPEKVYFKIK
ncbi:MAG: three-Cys-motif partner protein TcmP [Ferruginibacter sp.]